jgi:hypothetical protein
MIHLLDQDTGVRVGTITALGNRDDMEIRWERR